MKIQATQVHYSQDGTLAYLTRQNVQVEVEVVVPKLVPSQSHSELHSPIEGDMTHQFPHTPGVFCNDCVKLFNLLEEVTCGMK